MSTLAIILIILGALLVLVFLGGLLATRGRDRRQAGSYERHIAEADRDLEEARAVDKGWDRRLLEQTARAAVEEARPGFAWDLLHLVLVDDPPGIEHDRAHLVATGRNGEVRVVLARREGGWVTQSVE